MPVISSHFHPVSQGTAERGGRNELRFGNTQPLMCSLHKLAHQRALAASVSSKDNMANRDSGKIGVNCGETSRPSLMLCKKHNHSEMRP